MLVIHVYYKIISNIDYVSFLLRLSIYTVMIRKSGLQWSGNLGSLDKI